MEYSIHFDDKRLIYTSEWIEDINIDIKLVVNDKIVIDEDSFQSNIFLDTNKQSKLKIIEELNSIANTQDYVYESAQIGNYRFIISDIEYWATQSGKSIGKITLKKITP